MPFPVPLVPGMVIHEALLAAVQGQFPSDVFTLMLLLPPAALNDWPVGEIQ
ncbi:MAG: hypothetical protein M0Z79_07715 [Nitrospiraceae bacterium]|nr:hypothetical protein [Nitrospiraceae bacterium]